MTFFSFLALFITFGIGVVGTLFDYVLKDKHGNRLYGNFNVPKLTPAGAMSLILLVLSFTCSCVLAYYSNKDSEEKKNQMSQMSSRLQATQTNLSDTQKQLTDLASLDVSQFQNIATGLKSTTDTVLGKLKDETTDMTEVMESAADRVDRRMRGALTPVKNFYLELFFLGSPQSLIESGVADFNRAEEGTLIPPGNVQLFNALVCKSPGDATVSLVMPISDVPHLNVRLVASRKGSKCTADTFVTQGDREVSQQTPPPAARPQYWNQLYFPKERRDAIRYEASFPAYAIGKLPSLRELNAASFNTNRWARIDVNVGRSNDGKKMEEYFSSALPRVIGFKITPNDSATDLNAVGTFLLDNVAVYSPGGFVYTYKEGCIRKDRANWGEAGKAAPPLSSVKQLPNPYRESSVSAGPRLGHN